MRRGELCGLQWEDVDLVAQTVRVRQTLAMINGTPKVATPKSRRSRRLRHTHATQLLATGTNPRVVSERLGHANVAFTLQVYGHVLPGQQRAAAEAAAGLPLNAPTKTT